MSIIPDLTNNPRLGVVRLDTNAKLPTKAHYGDLGYDLYALEDITLAPGKVTIVRTGIACNFPSGVGALLRDRSSVATKKEVFVVAGVIDQGYTGEIKVAFFNPGWPHLIQLKNQQDIDEMRNSWPLEIPPVTEGGLLTIFGGPEEFKAGDKIAQMILTPVITIPVDEVTDLQNSTRGDKGFGSSGTN
jgi:dUTP pyrophosphatase